ncbi:hypothetical protein D3C72_855790 [compost metagenome]
MTRNEFLQMLEDYSPFKTHTGNTSFEFKNDKLFIGDNTVAFADFDYSEEDLNYLITTDKLNVDTPYNYKLVFPAMIEELNGKDVILNFDEDKLHILNRENNKGGFYELISGGK